MKAKRDEILSLAKKIKPIAKGLIGFRWLEADFQDNLSECRTKGERVRKPKVVESLKGDSASCPMRFSPMGYKGRVKVTQEDVLRQAPAWILDKANCYYVEILYPHFKEGRLINLGDDDFLAEVTFFHASNFPGQTKQDKISRTEKNL